MKKIRIPIIILLVIILLLPSCAAVPKNVQKDVNAFKQAREESEKLAKDMHFIKVSDVFKNTPQTLNYKNGIININAKVCVPQAEQVYKLELAPNDLYAEKDILLKSFLDDKSYANLNSLEYKDFPIDKPAIYDGIEDKSYSAKGSFSIEFGDNKVLSFDRCGWLSLYDKTVKMDEHFFPGTQGVLTSETFFYNEIGGDFSESVKINGEDCRIADVWKQFEDNVNYFAECVPNFNYKPYSLEFYDKDDDLTLKTIACRAAYEYNGVCFDPIYISEQNKKNYNISRVNFGFFQNFHCLNDDCFIALRDSYKVTKEIETYDKILDLDSAIKVMQTSLSKERFANIDTIELMYGMYYYGDKGEGWKGSLEVPPQFYAEPYWKFTETNDNSYLTVHYVNAVTGQFYSYNQSCFYFG